MLALVIGCTATARRPQPAPQAAAVAPAARSAAPRGVAAPTIALGDVTGHEGREVTVSATLYTAGAAVAGTQNDVVFDPARAAIAAKPNGKPDCAANAAIHKGITAFAFLPHGCRGAACASVRALVAAVDNVDPIPDGAVLYTCTLRIAPHAQAGRYTLRIGSVILSTPRGVRVPHATGKDGIVTIQR